MMQAPPVDRKSQIFQYAQNIWKALNKPPGQARNQLLLLFFNKVKETGEIQAFIDSIIFIQMKAGVSSIKKSLQEFKCLFDSVFFDDDLSLNMTMSQKIQILEPFVNILRIVKDSSDNVTPDLFNTLDRIHALFSQENYAAAMHKAAPGRADNAAYIYIRYYVALLGLRRFEIYLSHMPQADHRIHYQQLKEMLEILQIGRLNLDTILPKMNELREAMEFALKQHAYLAEKPQPDLSGADQVEALQADNQRIRDGNKYLAGQLVELQAELKQKEEAIAGLKRELNTSKQKADKANRISDTRKAHSTHLEEVLSKKNRQFKQLISDIERLKSELDEVRGQEADLKATVELKTQSEQRLIAKNTELKEQLESHLDNVQALQDRQVQLCETLKAKDIKIKALKSAHDKKDLTIAEQAASIQSLSEQLGSLSLEDSEQRHEISHLRCEITDLSEALEQAQCEIDDLNEALEQAKRDLAIKEKHHMEDALMGDALAGYLERREDYVQRLLWANRQLQLDLAHPYAQLMLQNNALRAQMQYMNLMHHSQLWSLQQPQEQVDLGASSQAPMTMMYAGQRGSVSQTQDPDMGLLVKDESTRRKADKK